jgi:hypothetical protein
MIEMGETTVSKLRRVSDGVKIKGYFLLPPRNWLNAIEAKEGKKIWHFTVKAEGDTLLLNPAFTEPAVSAPRNSSPEAVTQMLKNGSLILKLREIHKGKHVYRIVNIPRSWVNTKEQMRKRTVAALRVTTRPESLIAEPVFQDKRPSSY